MKLEKHGSRRMKFWCVKQMIKKLLSCKVQQFIYFIYLFLH